MLKRFTTDRTVEYQFNRFFERNPFAIGTSTVVKIMVFFVI